MIELRPIAVSLDFLWITTVAKVSIERQGVCIAQMLVSHQGQTVALGTQLIASAKGREAASPDDLCLKGVALGGPGCLSRWLKQQNPSWP